MKVQLYTAIVIFNGANGRGACKYHNINDIDKFVYFIRTYWQHKQVEAVNFYEKETKKFFIQIKIKQHGH